MNLLLATLLALALGAPGLFDTGGGGPSFVSPTTYDTGGGGPSKNCPPSLPDCIP